MSSFNILVGQQDEHERVPPPSDHGSAAPSETLSDAPLLPFNAELTKTFTPIFRHFRPPFTAPRSLPFLRRNLRAGFDELVRKNRPNLAKGKRADYGTDLSIAVTYRTKRQSYTISQTSWHCPLCTLFGVFRGREEMLLHLRWSHGDIEVKIRRQSDGVYALVLQPLEDIR